VREQRRSAPERSCRRPPGPRQPSRVWTEAGSAFCIGKCTADAVLNAGFLNAQTGAGRDILLQLREEHAEGSRTHYLAGSGTHCGNCKGLLLVKNKVGPQLAACIRQDKTRVRRTRQDKGRRKEVPQNERTGASGMGAMPRVHCTYSRRFAVARSRCNQGQEICV
jgi:hypothetical protein